ncbi:MAG TPA: hypothetical protein PKN32_11820 [Bacteroidales bacterium]|nr:hypothetical protein [Bacteroidales bacterium]
MQVFINECSLNEQLNKYTFVEAIKIFLRVINSVNKFTGTNVYKSVLFFNFKALKDTHIERSLKANFELNSVFSQNLKNALNWEKEQVHDEYSNYICNKEEYVKTSIAEISERKLADPLLNAILINFVDSKFSDNINILVHKNDSDIINVNCAFNESTIHEWLIERGFINPKIAYNEFLGLPPLDCQTVLCTSNKFELTKWRNGKFGRKVYRLIGSNQLWVVDNSIKHATNKAHIEVFDETTKKHLGTSIYNKIELNSKHIEKSRIINLV